MAKTKRKSIVKKLQTNTGNSVVNVDSEYNSDVYNNPKVSVIVAVYNGEKYLSQCIDSILAQTLKEIEVICVNDGSTDGTLEILQSYSRKDKRLKIIDVPNGGAGTARNIGMDNASGEYLSFLDADDFFDKDMLRCAYQSAIENNADVAIYDCDFYTTSTNTYEKHDWTLKKKFLPENNPFNYSDLNDKVFSFTVGWAWDKLFKRSFILEHNIRFFEKNVLEDAHFTCQACALAERIYYIDRVFAHYRCNEAQSLSNRIDDYIDDVPFVLRSWKAGLVNNGIYSNVERAFINRVGQALQNIFSRVSENVAEKFYQMVKDLFREYDVYGHERNYIFDNNISTFIHNVKNFDYEEYRKNENFLRNLPFKNVVLSVVIPVYNAENFIKKCLDSILEQSLKEIEVICVDDGSTDNSVSIIEEYARLDNRILLIKQENKNAGAARNNGIRFIHGRYVHFLDSDDWVCKDSYAPICKKMDEYSADMCVCWHKNFDNVTQKYEDVNSFKLEYGKAQESAFEKNYEYFCGTHVVPWNKIYRRKFIEDINAEFDEIVCANDRTFYFYTIFNAEKIVRYAYYIVVHRTNNSGSLAGSGRKQHFDCHISANSKIIEHSQKFNSDVREFVLNVNIGDLFRWLPESSEATKLKNFEDVISICEKYLRPFGLEKFRNRIWYPNAKIALLSREIKEKNNKIPVVFIAKNGKAAYLDVMLLSFIDHMEDSNYYDIYIFMESLSYESVKRLEAHKGENYRINCIDLKYALSKYASASLISRYFDSYSLLVLPELLYQYNKVLCFNGDLIFNGKITNLYKTDVDNAVLGAVSAFITAKEQKYIMNTLKLRGDKYVNRAVLVYNVNEFIKFDIKSKGLTFINAKASKGFSVDEMLSTACRANDINIKFIDSGWNYQHKAVFWGESNMSEGSVREYRKSRTKKYIINYNADKKPWVYPEFEDSIYFWKYMPQSSWADILRQMALITRMESLLVEGNEKIRSSVKDEISNTIDEIILEKDNPKEEEKKPRRKNKFVAFITWLPRKIGGFFRCWHQHGFKYTMIKLFKGKKAAERYGEVKGK